MLVLLIIFSLSGCTSGYSEEDLSAAKQEAYDEGYEAGYAGHELDHECEYTEADIEDAYNDGYFDATNEHECEYDWYDIDEAKSVGRSEGYDEGFDDGYSAGYDNGYADCEGSSYTASSYGADEYSSSYSEMVYIPNTGSKYHNNSACSGMKNPSYVSLDDAIAWGYTACKNCY